MAAGFQFPNTHRACWDATDDVALIAALGNVLGPLGGTSFVTPHELEASITQRVVSEAIAFPDRRGAAFGTRAGRAFGSVLCADGRWRSHLWDFDTKGVIYDPDGPHEIYVGVPVLDGELEYVAGVDLDSTTATVHLSHDDREGRTKGESMHATRVGNAWRLDNVPFHTVEMNMNSIVRCTQTGAWLEIYEVVEHAFESNVVFSIAGELDETQRQELRRIESLGGHVERASGPVFVAAAPPGQTHAVVDILSPFVDAYQVGPTVFRGPLRCSPDGLSRPV